MATEIITKELSAFRSPAKGEPEWLYRLRQEAWSNYRDLPLPNRAQHIWRYTRPQWFLPENPTTSMELPLLTARFKEQETAPLKSEFAAFGCQHGDHLTYTQISEPLRQSGVIFQDLGTALRDHPDLLQEYLGRLVGAGFGKFEALNLALWNSGLFLYIPSGRQIEKPIYMHRQPGPRYNYSRLLVVMGENARATIVDDYSGKVEGREFVANGAVELFLGRDSGLRYVNSQNLDKKVRSIITQRAEIGAGSEISSIFISLGGTISKYNLGTILNGRGASSRMLGMLLGNRDQHFDHHTMHHHRAPDSFSNIDFKVVLRDQALSAYTGLIRIEEKTLNCEAYQENRNLLLSRGTRAESIPELEILNDQVRCTHGATIGPLDPEMVFYLKSRGLSQDEAVQAIILGFLEPLFNQVPEDLRQMMSNLMEYKLMGEKRLHLQKG